MAFAFVHSDLVHGFTTIIAHKNKRNYGRQPLLLWPSFRSIKSILFSANHNSLKSKKLEHYTYMHSCMYGCMYRCMHACIHTCMHTYKHTQTYTRVYVHSNIIHVYI